MFALALWDRHLGQLHLVRDRFGEKPLYYGWVGGRLAFASELKASACCRRSHAEIDRDAVALYLRHNCVPGAAHHLPAGGQAAPRAAGHLGHRRPTRRHLATRAYWSAATRSKTPVDSRSRRTRRGHGRPLETVLSDSVAARMVADVPVGRLPVRRRSTRAWWWR